MTVTSSYLNCNINNAENRFYLNIKVEKYIFPLINFWLFCLTYCQELVFNRRETFIHSVKTCFDHQIWISNHWYYLFFQNHVCWYKLVLTSMNNFCVKNWFLTGKKRSNIVLKPVLSINYGYQIMMILFIFQN